MRAVEGNLGHSLPASRKKSEDLRLGQWHVSAR